MDISKVCSSNFMLNYFSIFFILIKSIYQKIMTIFFGGETTIPTRFKEGEGLECVICLSSISKKEQAYALRCDHIFHKSCMDRWLKSKGRTCPLCRDDLFGCCFGETIVLNPFETSPSDVRDTWWIRWSHVFPPPSVFSFFSRCF